MSHTDQQHAACTETSWGPEHHAAGGDTTPTTRRPTTMPTMGAGQALADCNVIVNVRSSLFAHYTLLPNRSPASTASTLHDVSNAAGPAVSRPDTTVHLGNVSI